MLLMNEIWKPIIDFEGIYEISNLGRCRSLDRYINRKNGSKQFIKGRILTPVKCTNGYLEYQINKDGKRYCKMAHRLVAEAFIPNPENKPEVNHKDEDIINNKVDNLEWMTSKENANYGTRNERCKANNKTYKKVVQLTLDGEYIATYDYAIDGAKAVGLKGSETITRCCKGKAKHSKGFKWMYEEDYLDMITLGEVI